MSFASIYLRVLVGGGDVVLFVEVPEELHRHIK